MSIEADAIRQLLVDVADEAGPLEASRERLVALVRRRRRVRTAAVALAVTCIAAGAALTVRVEAFPRPAAGPMSTPTKGHPRPIEPGDCVSTPPKPGAFGGDWRSCQYIGLTLDQARAQAAKEHRDLVIGSRDGVHFPMTYELRNSRVVVGLAKDRVINAIIG
ncbi:hypothetical protein [Kitasatospora sp. MAP5-34]|uniref:hypothetical protein n=1 Tax=Kitasatospora sp. MAP5-34 TaxID=3035102 RepID=UPI002473BC78|nr:hypothetical protein [Kitasatospora sp. MAP5-34]MDH6580675.1 hypothetical protein [Kitasatospora sp. MAP5-34]